MIKNSKPLSMAEVMEYIKKNPETGKEVAGFIKKFTKMKLTEARKFREKLRQLDMIKLNEKALIKVMDVLPENPEELNKVVDVNLNEDETKKILDTVKEFK